MVANRPYLTSYTTSMEFPDAERGIAGAGRPLDRRRFGAQAGPVEVLPAEEAAEPGWKLLPMNRRELLELLAVGVPALAGLSADQHEVLERSVPGGRRRGLLDPRQFATVDQLSELIIPVTDIPGARAAGVAGFIEHIVADWYGEDDRVAFLAGLEDVNTRSVRVSGRAFIEAPAAGQMAVVQQLESSLAGGNSTSFWARFKALTLYGFYNSEPGIRQVLKTPFMPGFYNGDVPVSGASGSEG
jgi:hypothetical protein